MADEKLRVAIMGTGMIANAGHIPAWKNLREDVEIVAVMDQSRKRAQVVATQEGIPRVYDDYETMLADTAPDIVSVCTPNAYHKDHTLAALKAGAHVFCEKPVATSYEDARVMYDTARSCNRILFTAQTSRFLNSAIAAQEFAASGHLGTVYYAESTGMRRRGIPTWGQFHMKEHSVAGPLYDLGVHELDLLLWLMGNPQVRSVSAATFTTFGNRDEGILTSLAESGAPLGVLTPRSYDYREFDVEDMAVAFIRLEGGGVVILKVSWAANIPHTIWQGHILGDKGGIELRPLKLVTTMGRYQVDVTPVVPEDRDVFFSGHWLATEHFLKVLRGEEELMVKPEEVLNTMGALEAIYRSAQEGRELPVATA